jgi:hypothetical protein
MPKTTPWGEWDHLPLTELLSTFEGLAVPWWIAGGFAIDAFAGSGRREHDDIDVSVFASDQLAVRRHLAEWEPRYGEGLLNPWRLDEPLPPSVHDIWVRRDANDAWRFQVMLNPGGLDELVYRRDRRIRLPLDRATHVVDGVRYLAPEVQLLFKSRGPREKDERDLSDCLPLMTAAQRQWLADALALAEPTSPWRAHLA